MDGPRISRKSCDFCYLRKIKCDAQKPRCSHCVAYARDCTYAAPSRQSRSKRRKVSPSSNENAADLHARVRHLEILLQQFAERSKRDGEESDGQNELQKPTPTPTVTMPVMMMTSEDKKTVYSGSSRSLDLPPLQQVLPVVHLFLEKSNSILPLFHPEILLRLLHTSYNLDARHRDPVAWAAINIVLALAHRQGLMGSSNVHHAVEYLGRAQSVLSNIVLDETELLNVQVLVGMVMLLQAAKDLQPALILIATTLRLAHRIGLHNRTSSAHLSPAVARQRAYVFWLAYILDKDLSLRSKQPSIQRDDDIDLDLPCPFQTEQDRTNGTMTDEEEGGGGGDHGVGTGIISTVDGTARMNYFVARIHLAVVEGGVYDYLYSTASQKRSPEERSHALESVASALEQWKASIPFEFSGSKALHRLSPTALGFLGVLDATSLLCTTLINQAHAWNPQWVTSLRKYDTDGTAFPLPPRWEPLVAECRDLVVLHERLGGIDRWNFWIIGCSYMTAMMLLTANTMSNPQHDLASGDGHLVDAALETLNRIVDETQNDELRSFQDTCAELHRHARQKRHHFMKAAIDRDDDSLRNSLDTGWRHNGFQM